MMMWNANERIDFHFAVQLDEAINSHNPCYIKSICRQQGSAGRYVRSLIGNDTWKKTQFVQAEVEIALEKGCRRIG